MKPLSAVLLLLLLLATGCAKPHPYTPIDPEPTGRIDATQARNAIAARWPEQFKTVQTVTIDFGPITRTLVGYLVVQRPGRFRLQGMTEQGIRLFDLVGDDDGARVVFAVEEFEEEILEAIGRDIYRLFASDPPMAGTFRASERSGGTRVEWLRHDHSTVAMLVGEDLRVAWMDTRLNDRAVWRVDHYEWQMFGDLYLPGVLVLRERAVLSPGPAYVLTVQVTEFETRETPWPARVFEPDEH